MAREVDAQYSIEHPKNPDRMLLLRQTTNPADPAGALAVLKEVSQAGYKKHYETQCPTIKASITKVIRSGDGKIDAVIVEDSDLPAQLLQQRQMHRGILSENQPEVPRVSERASDDPTYLKDLAETPDTDWVDEGDETVKPAQTLRRPTSRYSPVAQSPVTVLAANMVVNRFLSQFDE